MNLASGGCLLLIPYSQTRFLTRLFISLFIETYSPTHVFTTLMHLSVITTSILLHNVCSSSVSLLNIILLSYLRLYTSTYSGFFSWSTLYCELKRDQFLTHSPLQHFSWPALHTPHPALSVSHAGLSLFRLMSTNRNKYCTTFSSLDS